MTIWIHLLNGEPFNICIHISLLSLYSTSSIIRISHPKYVSNVYVRNTILT